MLYEIKEAVPHPDHTVTVTWTDGAQARVSLAPFLDKGGVFEALKDPAYFVEKMRVLPGGIGLTWPNEVDFSADGLRQDAFPAEATGEEPLTAAESERKPKPLLIDETALTLEGQARAYLAAHPEPPIDPFERERWQGMKDFVKRAEKLAARRSG